MGKKEAMYYKIKEIFIIFLNFIDKKIAFKSQLVLLKSYVFIGIPTGLILPQIIFLIISNSESIKFGSMLITLMFNIIFIFPIAFNYFRHMKRYKRFCLKISKLEETDEFEITAKYNTKKFSKGEKCKIKRYRDTDQTYVTTHNDFLRVKYVINQIDFDDLQDQRKQKLKRLNRL